MPLLPLPGRAELPLTPRLFQWQVMNTARRHPQRIILPEGNDKRVLTAAGELLRRGICQVPRRHQARPQPPALQPVPFATLATSQQNL